MSRVGCPIFRTTPNANAYLASEPTTILDANNNQIAMLYVQNRDSVTEDQISKYVLKALSTLRTSASTSITASTLSASAAPC